MQAKKVLKEQGNNFETSLMYSHISKAFQEEGGDYDSELTESRFNLLNALESELQDVEEIPLVDSDHSLEIEDGKYIGQLRDFKMHGRGTLNFENGDMKENFNMGNFMGKGHT